jgi:hypothetical protein
MQPQQMQEQQQHVQQEEQQQHVQQEEQQLTQEQQPVETPMDKHRHYKKKYLPNQVFWGLGVENETYIQVLPDIEKPVRFLFNNNRERYSVDYWTIYKKGAVQQVLKGHVEELENQSKCFVTKGPSSATVRLPRLINSHSFQNTDRFGQPQKTYAKVPRHNPRFFGTTMLEDLRESYLPEVRQMFDECYNYNFCFDGDTIEFITQDFYCTTVDQCVTELVDFKKYFLETLKKGMYHLHKKDTWLEGTLCYPPVNHGLAVFHTNRENVAIFNNSTYHINLTMPTLLNEDGLIADWPAFLEKHRQLARLFQWMSPLLVAQYGSGDVMGRLEKKDDENEDNKFQFPSGSQRLCVSRYVSVATYDTDVMRPGKLLVFENPKLPWMKEIYDKEECAYNMLNLCGCDINFHKHINHGLEFRIFDWFPEQLLPKVLRLFVYMADEANEAFNSLESKSKSEAHDERQVPNPLKNDQFHHLLARCVWEGQDVKITLDEVKMMFEVFRIPLPDIGYIGTEDSVFVMKDITTSQYLYNYIYDVLEKRWLNIGPISKVMI